jgi:hypothetical protein
MHAGLTDVPSPRVPSDSESTLVLNLNSFLQDATEDRKIHVNQKAIREGAWTATVVGLCVAAWCAAVAMGFFAFFLADSFYNYLSRG